MPDPEFIAGMLLLGAGVGLLSAALGLGGGVLMVPALLLAVDAMDVHTAKGTSLAVIVFVSLANVLRLRRNDEALPWKLAGGLAIGALVGGYLGAWGTGFLSERTVLWGFLLLLAFLAARTVLLTPAAAQAEATPPRHHHAVSGGIGLTTGIVSGATGTGGGAILIPLVLWARIAANRDVVLLSNMVMAVTSVAGMIAHLQAVRHLAGPWVWGQVYLPAVPLIFLGAQAGAIGGTRINHLLTPGARRIAMGILLLIITGQLLYRVLHMPAS